jgi:NAD(P)-dependent dehydrogenase (short-subunit alcohol dehydrogenase family)
VIARIEGRVGVVTGAAGGIGAALAAALLGEGATHVAMLDRDGDRVRAAAANVGGSAYVVNVTEAGAVETAVAEIERDHGPVGVFCSNAGLLLPDPPGGHGASSEDQAWALGWAVNVMAHVHAAKAVLPGMIERGEGWLLNTVSAAGLLSQIGSAIYSTTKHAALGFAESLAIRHRDDGIGVSVLCPQAVETPMLAQGALPGAALDGVLSADDVAAIAMTGIREGRFLILPHPKVRDYVAGKAADHDRWIEGMARLRRRELDR